MKKLIIFPVVICLLLSFSCDKTDNGLSSEDIIKGLKEALRVGTDTAVTKVSKLNGFYKDAVIKILLPPEAKVIVDNISYVPGGQQMVEDVIQGVNRSAEDAAKEATPIFVGAISKLTISDGMKILKDTNTAATEFMKANTFSQLDSLFRPKMDLALDKPLLGKGISAKSAYKTLTDAYNTVVNSPVGILGGLQPVKNTDLTSFVTQKGLNGLFYKVGEQEKLIRKDPLARVTDILKKVFGSQ